MSHNINKKEHFVNAGSIDSLFHNTNLNERKKQPLNVLNIHVISSDKYGNIKNNFRTNEIKSNML